MLQAAKRRLSGRALAAGECAGYVSALALTALCFAALASGGFAPFIYFQF